MGISVKARKPKPKSKVVPTPKRKPYRPPPTPKRKPTHMVWTEGGGRVRKTSRRKKK